MRSWKSAVNSVVRSIARSTCSSPSTSRRTFMPRSYASSLMLRPSWRWDEHRGRERLGLLDVREVRGAARRRRARAGDPAASCVDDRRRRRRDPPRRRARASAPRSRRASPRKSKSRERLAAARRSPRAAAREIVEDRARPPATSRNAGVNQRSACAVDDASDALRRDELGALVAHVSGGRSAPTCRRARAARSARARSRRATCRPRRRATGRRTRRARRRARRAARASAPRDVARRRYGRPGPASAPWPVVVAEHAIAARERRHLRVPDRGRRAERAGEDEHGRVVGAVEP